MKSLIALLAIVSLTASLVQANSNIDDVKSFAYGANTGWENWRHDTPVSPDGVQVDATFLSGFSYSANCGWINFGDGSPVNGTSYQNNSATDFGVNRDASGNLSGFAYGANIGWINYGWAGAADPNRPRFDPATGEFMGFAYSANCGWINLGTGNLSLDSGSVDPDPDGDFISTFLENAFDTDPNDKTSGREGLPTISQDGTDVTLEFRMLISPGSLTYTVQKATDAKNWTTATGTLALKTAGVGVTNSANLMTFTIPLPPAVGNEGPILYLRVLVED